VTRHQLDKFLLRHGRIWCKGGNWTQAYMTWVRAQTFEHAALTATREDAIGAVDKRVCG